MSVESNRLVRAFRLFWLVLGSARVYVAAAAAIILLLAALGLRHLFVRPSPSPVTTATASPSTTPAANSKAVARVSPSSPSSPARAPEGAIAITDVTEAEERGPRGETFIVAKIGMAPRTTVEKENVEIRVLFFDVDRNNEMHPTDAQVTYQWLTPIRDWTDPAPKYLAATYLQRRPFRRSADQLRYGGFVVRVYGDGKLQDERSKPEALIAALRSTATKQPAPDTSPVQTSAVTPQPFLTPLSRRSPDEGGSISAAPQVVQSPHPSDSPTHELAVAKEPLPYGKPIPGKPGFVQSPYDPKFIIDVRGFPPGTLVNDPNTNKPFRVP